jgi:hypothetical protein
MTSITLPIIWSSNEYIKTPEQLTVDFTPEDVQKIELYIDMAQTFNITISMDICVSVDYDDLDFVPEVECIKIYPCGSLYYYAQSKYNAADQIESKGFCLADLKN